jgi:hypothetical protein
MDEFSVIGIEIHWNKKFAVPQADREKIAQELKEMSEQIANAMRYLEDAGEDDLETELVFWLNTPANEGNMYGLQIVFADNWTISITVNTADSPVVAYLASEKYQIEPMPQDNVEVQVIN